MSTRQAKTIWKVSHPTWAFAYVNPPRISVTSIMTYTRKGCIEYAEQEFGMSWAEIRKGWPSARIVKITGMQLDTSKLRGTP